MLTLLLIFFLLPVISVEYHVENVGTDEKVVSIVYIMVNDVLDGTIGDKRVIRRFVVLPKRFDDETRFLDFSKIEQRYNCFVWVDLGWAQD